MYTVITYLHFKFSGLSLGYRLCIQSSTSKSRQKQFVTKITGESVLNNVIDLRCSVNSLYMERKMAYSRYVLKIER